MKVLFLYYGRRSHLSGKINLDYPDTQFFGLNHLYNFNIHAEHKEPEDFTRNKIILRIIYGIFWRISIKLRNFFLGFFMRQYDAVFGSTTYPLIVFKKLFGLKTKVLLFDIAFSKDLQRSQNNILKFLLLKYFANQASAIICVSKAQQKYLSHILKVKKNRIVFLPLGVDIKFHYYKEQKRENFILSVGKDAGRDYATLLRAAERLPIYKFVFVCGQGSMKGLDFNLDNVQVLYNIPPKELNDLYHRAQLLILTIHSDNYPYGSSCSGQTVLLDAMACGLPVIVTYRSYLADYHITDQEAFIVQPYDHLEIKRLVETCFHNEALLGEKSKNARMLIEKNFTTYGFAGRLAHVLNEL